MFKKSLQQMFLVAFFGFCPIFSAEPLPDLLTIFDNEPNDYFSTTLEPSFVNHWITLYTATPSPDYALNYDRLYYNALASFSEIFRPLLYFSGISTLTDYNERLDILRSQDSTGTQKEDAFNELSQYTTYSPMTLAVKAKINEFFQKLKDFNKAILSRFSNVNPIPIKSQTVKDIIRKNYGATQADFLLDKSADLDQLTQTLKMIEDSSASLQHITPQNIMPMMKTFIMMVLPNVERLMTYRLETSYILGTLQITLNHGNPLYARRILHVLDNEIDANKITAEELEKKVAELNAAMASQKTMMASQAATIGKQQEKISAETRNRNIAIGVGAGAAGLALAGGIAVAAGLKMSHDAEAAEREKAQETMKLLGASATALDHFFAKKGLNPATRLDQQTLNEHGVVKLNKLLRGKDDQIAYRAALQDLLNQAKNLNSPQGLRAREQLQALTNALRVNIGDFSDADLVMVAAVLHHLGANSYPLDMHQLTGDNLEEISKILKARPDSGFTVGQQEQLKVIADSSVGTLSSIWGWITGDDSKIAKFV